MKYACTMHSTHMEYTSVEYACNMIGNMHDYVHEDLYSTCMKMFDIQLLLVLLCY